MKQALTLQPRVVVVDNDEAVRRALHFSLEMDGFTVDTCDTGEALLLRALPPDNACLVLDQRLPGISGLETLSQLRRRRVDLPAVLMTTHPKPELRAAAAAAGVEIVEKPLMGDTLLSSIRAALSAGQAFALAG